MARLIPLSAGKHAVVDDEDYKWLMQWKWSFNGRYAARNDQGRTIFMHREIAKPQQGLEVDHIDGNRLNNCRSNLRICTHAQNSKNRSKSAGTSQYKGVSFNKAANRWEAKIRTSNTNKSLGYYDSEYLAALAYDEVARLEYGEYAKPNFPGIQESIYSQEQERLKDKRARVREMKRLLVEETPIQEIANKLGFKPEYVRQIRSRMRTRKVKVPTD